MEPGLGPSRNVLLDMLQIFLSPLYKIEWQKNAFTCKTCASGKKQDVTHEYRALTRKRIASVSENESDHAVAKKKTQKDDFVCRVCNYGPFSSAGNLKRHLLNKHKTDF